MYCPTCLGNTIPLNFKNGMAWCPICGSYYIIPNRIIQTEQDEEKFRKWLEYIAEQLESNTN